MKLAFDDEVKADDIDTVRKLMTKLRQPATVLNTFAFTGYVLTTPLQHHADKNKDKHSSLRYVLTTSTRTRTNTRHSGIVHSFCFVFTFSASAPVLMIFQTLPVSSHCFA